MSRVTVLYGPAYDGKNDEMFNRCLQKIRSREGRSCVYLVRSDVRVRRLREQLLQEFSGCFHFPVSTLPVFLKALYRQTPAHKKILGELEQKILLENILHAYGAKREGRSYLKQFREHPGIVAKVQEFLAGLRRVGFAFAEELAPRLRACRGRPQQAYEELLELFRLYTRALEKAGKIDEGGIFLDLARTAEAGELDIAHWTDSPELLVLEGYYEMTLPVQQIFSAICAQFEQTFITLDLPDNPYEYSEGRELPKAFRVFRHILPYIRQSGFSVRQYKPDVSLSHETGFSKTEPPQNADHILQRAPEQVSVHAYANRKEEVIRIAGEIRRLQQSGKIAALREVGVAFPLVEHYEHLIQEIFPRYGIPFSMFQGNSLSSSPVVISIFRLFQVFLDEYALDALQALFSSPLLQWSLPSENSPETTAPPVLALDSGSIHHLESLARRLEIRRGRQEWHEKLAEVPLDRPEQPLEDALIPSLQDFFDFLGRFDPNERQAGGKYLNFIREAIQRLQLPHRILQTKDRIIREQESAALGKFLKLLDLFQQELHEHSSEQSRYFSFSPREFYELLRTIIMGERYYVRQNLDDSVFILGRLDTRQLRFRYFFFAGLIERDFPGQDTTDIFLSEQDAQRLGLPGYHDKFEEAAHLFYLNTLNPSEQLYLSYPLQEEEKDLLRSNYLEQLDSQLKTERQNLAGVEADASSSPLETLYTYSELYEWLGSYWYSAQSQEAASEEPERLLTHILRNQKGTRAKSFFEALKAQQSRDSRQLSAFDGMVTARWSKTWLQRHYRPQQHVYSVSEFDLYARCPIKFFFRRVLRLAPPEDVLPEMDALEKGILLHRILYRFYAPDVDTPSDDTFGNVDRRFLQVQADKANWRRQARIRLAEIATEELAAYPYSGAFGEHFRQSLVSGLPSESTQHDNTGPEQQGLLATFVEAEYKNEDKVRQPCCLEAHFGMAGLSGKDGNVGEFGYQLSSTPCELRGSTRDGHPATIRFQGKIDRIDLEDEAVSEAGETGRKAILYDYKSGRTPTSNALKEGRSFQLPLYLLAARKFLGDVAEIIAGGYYVVGNAEELAKKNYLGRKEHSAQKYFKGHKASLLDSSAELQTVLQHYANLAVQAGEDIQNGRFHPTFLKAREAGCAYCDYRRICRLDPQRMKQIRSHCED